MHHHATHASSRHSCIITPLMHHHAPHASSRHSCIITPLMHHHAPHASSRPSLLHPKPMNSFCPLVFVPPRLFCSPITLATACPLSALQSLLPLLVPSLLSNHSCHCLSPLCSPITLATACPLSALQSLLPLLVPSLLSAHRFLPLCLDTCLRLLQQGADRDAAVLQQVVESVAQMVKHLRHYLTPHIVTLLKMTKALRFYPADYVRELVAHSLAFVLRTAPPKQMARGVRWVLAEARAVVSEERESGVALLLANAAKGPAHSLHSKAAPLLLRLLLLPSSLRPPALLLLQGQRAADAADVALTVVTRVIRLLAAHLTPATAAPLLTLLLTSASQAVQGRRDGCKGGVGGEDEGKGEEQGDGEEGEEGPEGKEGGGGGGGGRWEEARRIADVVHLLNAALQHRRGMLVTHLSPFVSLSLSLASHPLLLESLRSSSPLPHLSATPCSQQQHAGVEGEAGEEVGRAAGAAGDAPEGEGAAGEGAGEGGSEVQGDLVREVMLLLLGVMRRERRRRAGQVGEGQEWGGEGEEGEAGEEIARAVPRWEVLFDCSNDTLLPDPVSALNRLAASHSAPVLLIFLELAEKLPDCHAASTLHQGGRGGEGKARGGLQQLVGGLVEGGVEGEGEEEEKGGGRGEEGVGEKLGASLDLESGEGREEEVGEGGEKGGVRKRRKGQQGEESSERAAAAAPLPALVASTDSHQGQQQQQQQQQQQEGARGAWEGVLAAALETHSLLLSSHSAAHLPRHLPLYLSAARHHCRSLPILSAVALFLQAFPRAQVGDTSASLPAFPPELTANHMLAMLEALQDNFCHPAREMRVASLRIICHFSPLLVRVFHQMEELESAPYDLQMGRHAATALAALAAHATSARLPNQLLPAVTRCVLGLLHSKFAMMWQPAIGCLAALLSAHPSSTWPVVWRELHHLQGSFLLTAAGAPAESGGGAQGEGQGEEGGEGGEEEEGEHEDGEDGSDSAAAGITTLFQRSAMAVPSGAPPSAVLSSLLRALRQAAAVAATRLSPAPPPPPSVGTSLAPRVGTSAADLASGQQRRGMAGQQLAVLFLAFVGDSDDCLYAPLFLPCLAPYATPCSTPLPPQLISLSSTHTPAAPLRRRAHTGQVEMIQGGADGAGREEGEEAEEGVVVNRAMVRGKQWHVVLSDWLELLKRIELTVCGPKGESLKHVIIDRFLVHPDPAVQQLALDCLVAWRHGCLPKYAARLAALASYRSLKETLTTWNISPVDEEGEGEEEEEGRVAEADRASVIPVIIRLLLPKLKKRSGQLAGKAAAGVQRGTVLTFLARLPPSELLPLFHLMLLPFRPALRPVHQAGEATQGEAGEEAWQQALRQGATEEFLLLLGDEGDEGEGGAVGVEGEEGGAGAGAGAGAGVGMVGRKRVSGFLHLAVDVVRVMSRQQLQPYVLALLAVAVRTVQCYPPLPPTAGGEGRVEEMRDGEVGEGVQGKEKEMVEEEGDGKEVEEEFEEEERAEEEEAEEEKAKELEGGEGQRAVEGADAAAAEGPDDADKDGHKEVADDAPDDNDDGEDDDHEGTNTTHSLSPHVPSWTRDLRSLALRVLAAILAKFPDIATRPSLPAPLRPWPLLLSALSPALTHLATDNAASSEPSVLLALLLALSRSPRLALLLASHLHALPALSALLSAPSARLPVVGAAMGVLSHVVAWGVVEREEGEEGEVEGEVVLQWEQAGGEMGGEVEGVRVAIGKAVEGHLAAILPHMQQFIARQGALYSKGAGRALKASALAVVGRMAGMVTHAHLAGQLAAALTPFLRQAAGGRRRVDESTTAAVLAVLQSLAPLLSRAAAATCVRLFAPLLTHLQSRPARLALVHTLSALAAAHPSDSMRLLASLVADLCAYDPARIDEYDYTRRLHAYTSMHCHLPTPPAAADTTSTALHLSAEQVQQQVVVAVGREGCLLLLSCAVRDMADDDMSLRHSAAHFLQSFVRLAAALAALPAESGATAGARKGREGEEGGVLSGREAREVVNAVMLRHIKKGLHSPIVVVRREWVLLLRDVALHMGATSPVAELRCLVREDDVEADFFHNLVHLQTHRRVRALSKFAALCPTAHFSTRCTNTTLCPPRSKLSLSPPPPPLLHCSAFSHASFSPFPTPPSSHTFPHHQEVLLDAVVPALLRQLVEGRPDSESGVIDATIAALSAMAALLPWPAFHSLLSRLLALLPRRKEKGEQWWEESKGRGGGRGGEEVSAAGQRAILRAICGVLEQVKHVVGVGGREEKGEGEEEKGEKEGVDWKEGGEEGVKDGGEAKEIADKESEGGKEESRQVTAAEAGKEEAGAAVSLRIQQVLLKDIIPQLSKHLVAGEAGREEVNSHVALAVTRTLLLLPPDAIRAHLPVLLQTVVNPLKSRSQGTRDAARAALCQVAGALGPAYLGYVIGVLRSALTRGFERHVLGFTLHALLLHAASTHDRTMPPGALDYCLGECLAVAVEGLLGQVAEEREVDAVAAGVREKRQSRSLETVRIAASLVNVRRSTALLLAPIRAALPASLDPRVKRHVQEMVRHMAIGLLANQHATAGDLLVLVHAVLWEGVRVEQAHAAAAGDRKRLRAEAREGKGGGEGRGEEGGMEGELGEEGGMEGEEAEGKRGRGRRKKQKGLGFEGMPNGHVVALLGLQLLLSLASHDRLPASDPALTPRLNALVHPLSLTLSSPHDAVLAASFRALAFLLHRRLPSVATVAPRVATSAFKVVQQAGRAAAVAGGMVHSCLKLLAVLLERCPEVRVGEEQVRALLGSAVFTDLELPSTRTTAFAVLRALLRRRVVVPEVYDAMGRVQLLLLRSHTPSVRQLSAALLLAFLLDYPLGPARLEAHLSFLIVNLKYEHQSGREAVLGMLRAIIEGFPSVLVEAHADTFFLPLVTRLVSDESARVAAVLKALFVRVKPPTCARLLRFASAWLVDPSPQLQQAAALVLGVAVEAVGVGGEQGGMVGVWMGAAVRIVQRAQGGEEGGVEGWKGVYACVVLAEKVLQREGGQAHSSSMRALWRQLPALLLHRHLWVRAAACRLLGAYLSHATTAAASAAAGGGGSKGVCGHEEEGLKAVVRELVERGEQDEGENEEEQEGEGRGAGVAVWQVLLQPSYLVVVAGALCRVLESNASDERLAQHTVKNLVALAPLLPLLPCRAATGAAGGGMRKGREKVSGLVVELDGCEIGREGRGRLKLGWQLLRVRRREGEGTGDGSGGEEDEEEEEEEEEVLGEAEGGVEGGIEEEEKAEEEEEEEKGDEEAYLLDFGEGSGVGDADAGAAAADADADPGADADADADADMEATGAGGGAVMLGEPVGEGSGEAGDGDEAEERQQSDGEEGGAEEQVDGEGQPDGGLVASREGGSEEAVRHIALGAVMKAVARVAYRVKPIQTAAALRCVAALATALGGEGVRPYLGDVMLPLFRLSQGSAGAVVPREPPSTPLHPSVPLWNPGAILSARGNAAAVRSAWLAVSPSACSPCMPCWTTAFAHSTTRPRYFIPHLHPSSLLPCNIFQPHPPSSRNLLPLFAPSSGGAGRGGGGGGACAPRGGPRRLHRRLLRRPRHRQEAGGSQAGGGAGERAGGPREARSQTGESGAQARRVQEEEEPAAPTQQDAVMAGGRGDAVGMATCTPLQGAAL
ncbi:unnamed protein product [Closterium sp. Naga37s-1]|nr:unnamed protein product [Closterium sp. Naga37s-1]